MPKMVWDGRVAVYRYRCPAVGGRRLPEEALEQLRLAHDLRNDLVRVERDHDERVAQVWLLDPDVAAAQADVDAAEALVLDVATRLAEARKVDRSREPRAELKELARTHKAALRAAKTRRDKARTAAYPSLKNHMVEARRERSGKIVAAGKEAKARGLLWHTHDVVLAKHDVAVKAVQERRKAGQPAELRFRRWTGEGTLTVTLMRHEFIHGCGGKKPPWPCAEKMPRDCPDRIGKDPVRDPMLLTSEAGPWRNVIRLAPHMNPGLFEVDRPRRQGVREVVLFRLGETDTGPLWWEVPVWVHRAIPAEGDVTTVQVTRRRVAGSYRLSVAVTVRLPASMPRSSGDAVAVDLGWRSVEGGLRVATIVSTGRLPQPPDQPELAGVIRLGDDRRRAEVLVPSDWRDVWTHAQSVRAVRDVALDAIRDKVTGALTEGVEGLVVTPADVSRWRSPGRFAGLARAWPSDHELFDVLEAWRRQDRHLWEIEAHERDQIVARRRDAWRKVAAWLCHAGVGVLVDEEMSVSDLAVVPALEDGDDPQAVAARAQRQVAAPGELRAAIRAAASREGIRHVGVNPAGTTRRHAVCGNEISDPAALAESVMVWCSTCQIMFDQDVNAAVNLLGSLGDLADPAGGDAP